MAGKNETPRQKMVGMMYLVLTALLALQVSSAMIYKFLSLNESLENTVKETSGMNEKKLANIAEEVKTRGNRSSEVKLVNSAKEISVKSKDIISYVEELKEELIKESGGYDEDGRLKGEKEETKVEVIMIGANKKGKGYELKKRLDEYLKFINQNSSTKFSPLALDAKDDPLFKNNEEQKNKDFAELNFGQTPLAAGLAILSEIQSRVSAMEATILNDLSKKIAIGDFKFDKMQPMASPVSRVVAAGTKYEAKVFMTATSSTQKPHILFGNNEVQVDDNGVGKISFTATGGAFDPEGNLKKTWSGKITVKKPDGKDTTYIHTEDYIVTKPVIQIQADVVKALYRNCGNKLSIQVPALGNAYNPRFTAEGANLIPGTKKGSVTIVPTGAIVNLKLSSDGNYIGEEKFRVKIIPAPTLEVKVGGRRPDPLGVPLGNIRSITVKTIPDKDFAESLPDDAMYRVVEWKLTIARGRRAIAPPKIYTTESVDVTTLIQNAQERDNLIIEVVKVKRRNFRGEWEEISVPNPVQIIPIN